MTDPVDDEAALGRSAEYPSGLIFARMLNGKGGCRPISWTDITGGAPGHGETLWLHVDRTSEDMVGWLRSHLAISEATMEVLTSNETRPRMFVEEGALITVLRGVNLNPGADPEDMIAMQIWADASRVVTLRRRRLQTPRDVLASLDAGNGPKASGDLVTELMKQMVARMNRTIVDTNDRIDQLEAGDGGRDANDILNDIAGIRRYCLALKRFMTPQHEALLQLAGDTPEWMSDGNRRGIRETVERLRRYLDDLDVSKESALVLQDDLNNRAAAQANKTMYMLSLVAAIFLPLGFLTGLLGINVGGMPGVDSPAAFWVTIALLTLVLGVQLAIFKRLKWF